MVNDPAGAAGAAVRHARPTSRSSATGTATARVNVGIRRREEPRSSSSRRPPGSRKVVFGIPSDRADRRRLGRQRDGRGRRLPRRRPARSTCGPPTARRRRSLLGDADDLPVTGRLGRRPASPTSGSSTRRPRPSRCGSSTPTGRCGRRIGPARRGAATCRSRATGTATAITDLGVWTPATATFTQGRTVFPMATRARPRGRPRPRLDVTTIRFGRPAAEPGRRSALRRAWPGRRGAASRPSGRVSANVCTPPSRRSANATVPGRKTGFLKATSTVTASGSRFSIAATAAGHGPHAVRDLPREAERPGRQRVEVDRVVVTRDAGVACGPGRRAAATRRRRSGASAITRPASGSPSVAASATEVRRRRLPHDVAAAASRWSRSRAARPWRAARGADDGRGQVEHLADARSPGGR